MGAMFRAFFSALASIFRTAEKLTVSLENLADVGVATSGQFKDQAEQDRAIAAQEAEAQRLVRELKAKQALAKAKAAAQAAAANQQTPNQQP